MAKSLSEIMRERREAISKQLEALAETVEKRGDGFTVEERAQIDSLLDERREVSDRVEQLEAQEAREAATAEARRIAGETGEQRPAGGAQVTDPEVYARGNGRSYFRDMGHRAMNDALANESVDRLVRHSRQLADESRALGNTGATGGSGGEFAPPTWMVDAYIQLLRPGRVAAELMNHNEVPVGTSSINLPKVASGTSVALQTTQNSVLSQTDMTTSFVSTGFATLGGLQTVSQQMLDQAAINFDEVILRDLAAEHTRQVGINVLTGAGDGTGTGAVVNGIFSASIPAANQIAWTEATPSPKGFIGALAQGIAQFESTRFAAPTALLVHPRRYWWLASKSDSSGRPLIVPAGVAQNPLMTGPGQAAPGYKGDLLGIPVFTDANLPTNQGAGTNQDTLVLARWSDLEFFESPLRVEAFREPVAASVGVLFRAYSYVGTILNRFNSSIVTITGTGAVTPSFG